MWKLIWVTCVRLRVSISALACVSACACLFVCVSVWMWQAVFSTSSKYEAYRSALIRYGFVPITPEPTISMFVAWVSQQIHRRGRRSVLNGRLSFDPQTWRER